MLAQLVLTAAVRAVSARAALMRAAARRAAAVWEKAVWAVVVSKPERCSVGLVHLSATAMLNPFLVNCAPHQVVAQSEAIQRC